MNKLLQTLCVLLTLSSSQSNATNQYLKVDTNKLLAFNQAIPSSNNVEALYKIPSYKARVIKQPFNDFDTLYQRALIGQVELEKIGKSIALQTNTIMHSSGIKTKARAVAKVNNKFAGVADKITDISRISIVAKTVEQLTKSYELLKSQTQLLQVKNRFSHPRLSGYRDLNLLVKLANSNIIAEVQLHLEAFSIIKNGKEHDNYEQIQQLERLTVGNHRLASLSEISTINKLRNESKTMYQDAWNQYKTA